MISYLLTLRQLNHFEIEDLEKLGIHFDFKDLRNGELVERTHYHRRDNRQTRSHKLDNRMIGMVKKTK